MSSDMMKDFLPEQQRADRVCRVRKKSFRPGGPQHGPSRVGLATSPRRSGIPILGARKLTQLQDNLASFDLALSTDQVKILDDASRIDMGFPQELYTKEFPRALRYGGMRDQIAA
jgi:hypothetical protein